MFSADYIGAQNLFHTRHTYSRSFQTGNPLSDNNSDQISEKIDKFAEKYKLWLVIPLVICAFIALKNFHAGLGFLAFFVSIWVFIYIIGICLRIVAMMLPEKVTPDAKRALQEAFGATFFLGGCAIIGMTLRGDNVVSKMVTEKLPGGMSLGFIDPVFAVICLLCIWAYTAYRITR